MTGVLATARTIIRFARVLNHRLRDMPNGTGLTLPELNVLAGVERGYNLSSVLARELLLDAPRVSRIVESLADGGYVAREADQIDRRRCYLRLTPEGSRYLARGRAELETVMQELLSGLTGEERAALETATAGLQRVLASKVDEPQEVSALG